MTSEEMIERVREIAPIAREEAQQTEIHGRPSDRFIDAFCDAGLMQMMVPKALGGHESKYSTMAAVVSEIGKYCTSTAWVTSFYLGHNYLHCLFPKESQEEVFKNRPYVLMAGTVAPNYKMTPVEGGYTVSGRSQWNSGSSRAEYFMAAGFRDDGDNASGPLAFLAPAADVRKLGNWDVAAMRGSASGDIELDNVFVPAYNVVPVKDLLAGESPGSRIHANPMYSLPMLLFLFGEVLPVIVSAYRGAADNFRDLIFSRQSSHTGAKFIEKQASVMRVGRALAGAEVTEDLLQIYAQMIDEADIDFIKGIDFRARMRARTALITDYCNDGIQQLMLGAGGNAFRNDQPLQRFFRDISVLRVHAYLDLDTATEAYGLSNFGIRPNCPL